MELEISIFLRTKQQIYAVPEGPYNVPHTTDAVLLNELLANLVKSHHPDAATPKEFDFLIANQLLRQPLRDHLDELQLPREGVVDVEYIKRTPAPQPQDSVRHDDWVSGVHTEDNWILTGCYDHTVNILTTHGKIVASCKQHSQMVKKVAWLRPGDPSKGFVSVSHDTTALLWEWEPGTDMMTPKIALRGHGKGLDAVGVNSNIERLATGGWDTNLKIWSTSFLTEDEEEPAMKRIKGPHNISTRTPLHTLKGHKEAIQGINWIDDQMICTVCMDHTIKFWDVNMCGLKNEIVGEKAFLGCSWSPLNNTLLTCSADRHIHLYDPRSSEGSMVKTTFKSHMLWVSTVKWSTFNEHLFVSGGYDACVKMWDTRSPSACLYDLKGHAGQVLEVDWSNDKYIVSGGTDNSVHVFKNKMY